MIQIKIDINKLFDSKSLIFKMKIAIVILVLVKCCLADDCTGIPNCFETIPTTIEFEWNIIYPGNFTSTCIANGCPTLNNIRECPSNSNTQNVNTVLQTAGRCLKNPMCGVTMDPVPIKEVTFVTQQLLGAFSQFISGSCNAPAGKGFVYNTSTIQTTVTTNSQNINYPLVINTVIPQLLIQGTLGCNFKILSIIPININSVGFSITITYNSEILQTVSKSDTASQIQSSNFQVTSSSFDLGILQALNIGTIFSSAIQSFLQSSTFAAKINQFLANLYTGALETVVKNCS